jgi:hypothetical protein
MPRRQGRSTRSGRHGRSSTKGSPTSTRSDAPVRFSCSPAFFSVSLPPPSSFASSDFFHVQVDAGATTTLIEFYSTSYKSSAPLPGWIKRIRDGQITVDGEVATDPDMILREGSKLVYHRLPWQEPFAPHLLDVLYEDDDMIALNKPSGLQVLPKGLFQQRTVLAQLQLKDWKMPSSFCSKRKDAQSHPVPVHRLGRGTSGLFLCFCSVHAQKPWSIDTQLSSSGCKFLFTDHQSVKLVV